MEQRCRDEALHHLSSAAGAKRRAAWLAVGAAASEDALAQAVLDGGPTVEAAPDGVQPAPQRAGDAPWASP
jgi:hypothetical protein